MRSGLALGSFLVSMLGALSAFAQDAPPVAAPAVDAPPAPPAGYPAPPPGYPPPGYVEAPQERTANNALYIEGLGPGLLYSFDYDRVFGDFAARVGFGYISVSSSASDGNGNTSSASASLLTVPLTLSYIGIGSKKHIFEVGAGATILHAGAGASSFAVDDSHTAAGSTTLVYGDLIFGYRLQPPDGGFLLRAGIAPIFGSGLFLPWPYIALGAAF